MGRKLPIWENVAMEAPRQLSGYAGSIPASSTANTRKGNRMIKTHTTPDEELDAALERYDSEELKNLYWNGGLSKWRRLSVYVAIMSHPNVDSDYKFALKTYELSLDKEEESYSYGSMGEVTLCDLMNWATMDNYG
jgi:hypothetical protein